MNKLKKATKILSILDIVFVSVSIVYSLIYHVLADSIELTRDIYFDYILWSVLAVLALAAVSIVLFMFTIIIRTVHSKKIIKEKSVIGACIVNVIFVALIFVYIDKLGLWFIFA